MNETILEHHGILGQKWGSKNGPPYPLKGGDYSQSETKAIFVARKSKNSIYNKKHFDDVLEEGKKIRTLSYNKDRTKNSEMFYAATNFFDKKTYDLVFNGPAPKSIKDENGKSIGSGLFCKYSIDNKLTKDLKVASEDSGAKIFGNLYKNNRDFYNFVTSEDRMHSYFDKSKKKYKGYAEAEDALIRAQKGQEITDKDITNIYRMFNLMIPFDGRGNQRAGKDMAAQRARFFMEAKKAGYGALLDTNDAIYGGLKAKSPVIVFDMDSLIPDKIRRTNVAEKVVSGAVYTFGKPFNRIKNDA